MQICCKPMTHDTHNFTTSEKARSDVVLGACPHNIRLTQSAILGALPHAYSTKPPQSLNYGPPISLLHRFAVSTNCEIVSHSAFSELALYRLLAFPPFLGLKLVIHHSYSASTPVPYSVCSTSCSEGDPTNPLLFL